MWFLGVSVTFTGRVSLANTAAGRIQTLAQDNEMKYIIEMFLLASAHKKRSLSLSLSQVRQKSCQQGTEIF